MNRRNFLGLAVAGIMTQPAWSQPRPKTIRYAATPGAAPNLQSLDLYAESIGSGRPLVAFIHGGGWRQGDKANAAHGVTKADYFLKQGFAFASLNYRLSPAAMHPAHIEDVAAALAWLHTNAEANGVNPNRIYLMGPSAGAHLAALAATDERRLAAHRKSLSIIKGAVLLDGAGYDMTRRSQRDGSGIIAQAFGSDPAMLADASPLTHVAPGKGIPPFLIVHTDRRQAVDQAQALAAALKNSNVEASLFNPPDYTHADVNRRFGQPSEPVTAATMAALKQWGA